MSGSSATKSVPYQAFLVGRAARHQAGFKKKKTVKGQINLVVGGKVIYISMDIGINAA